VNDGPQMLTTTRKNTGRAYNTLDLRAAFLHRACNCRSHSPHDTIIIKNLSSEIKEVFSDRLRAAMRRHSLTQKSLGDAVGVVPSAVFNWLHGTLPGSGELYRLSKVLHEPMGWFFEVIPYNQPPKAVLGETPIAMVPADAVPPELRGAVEDGFVVANTPGLKEEVEKAWVELSQRAKSKEASKVMLDNTVDVVDNEGVKRKIRSLSDLISELRKRTKVRGQKAALARHAKVTRQAVDQWLSGNSKPSAKTMFLLLKWVERPEHPK
jgi:transcriptional regulator with XRE-family HTH domain